MTDAELRTCRVCGFIYDGYYPWGEDGNSSSFDICRCCGVEFGYGDNNLIAIKNWRKKWMASDAQWRHPEEKPSDWLPEEQLKNIPKEYQ